MLCCVVLCCVVLCCVVLCAVCCAVLCCVVLCCVVLCCVVLCAVCCAVLCCAVLCCVVLFCVVLCCVLCAVCCVLCCVVLCCAVLCCVVLCCVVLCLLPKQLPVTFPKVLRVHFLIKNQPDAPISQIYFGMKLYMFRTVPLSNIRSYALYTQQCYVSYRFVDSLRAGSGWNRGTVRNM